MNKKKLSPELIAKINATELPDIKIRCDRNGYYNEFSGTGEKPADLLPCDGVQDMMDKIDVLMRSKVVSKPPVLELSDDDIPQDMKNIGINICRVERAVFMDKLCEKQTMGATSHNYPHVIGLYVYMYGCNNDEEMKLAEKLISEQQSNTLSNLYHELKHVKTALLLQHRPYASDYKEPTVKEKFLLRVEDERTATFNSYNEILKKYLRAGNYEDFSMFPEEMDWVVEKLKGKSPEQIKKLCYPPVKLMNEALADWNEKYLDDYFEQFQRVCEGNCCDSLLIPVDTSGNEFKKQRSLMYTYEVYNPYTNKTEMIDLSPAIEVGIPISNKVKKGIIKPCEEKREKAKNELYALIPDKKTEILAANFAETLKREKIAQWLAQSKNSDAESILDKVRFAEPVKVSKRNFIAKHIKMTMSRLPSGERMLEYAAVIGAFAALTSLGVMSSSSNKNVFNKNNVETEYNDSFLQIERGIDMDEMNKASFGHTVDGVYYSNAEISAMKEEANAERSDVKANVENKVSLGSAIKPKCFER